MVVSSHPHSRSASGAFTIVELLIVIVVIGILAAITIIAYNGIQAKATVASLQSDLENDNKQLIAYLTTSSTGYPVALDCSASPAANTICLKSSGTTTYQYSVNNSSLSAPTYCITATSNITSYYYSSATGGPTIGACPGHGVAGVAPITNMMTNPSFETNLSGWTNGGCLTASYVTTGSYAGSDLYRGTRTTASCAMGIYSPNINVNAGTTYYGSVYSRATAGTQFTLRLRWMTSGGTTVSDSSVNSNATGGWQRLSFSDIAPATTTNVSVQVILTGVSAAVGDIYDVDAAMLTQGTTLYNYADGNSTNWAWTGALNLSTSTGPAL